MRLWFVEYTLDDGAWVGLVWAETQEEVRTKVVGCWRATELVLLPRDSAAEAPKGGAKSPIIYQDRMEGEVTIRVEDRSEDGWVFHLWPRSDPTERNG